MLRRITVVGNLTKDAEVKDVQNRKAINFAVAVNEYFKDAQGEKLEKSTFYNCVIWRDENVNVSHFLTKGTKVFIEGTPEPELFKTKDGEWKAAIKVIVSNLLLLGGGTRPSEDSSSGSNRNNSNSDKDLPF